MLSYFLESERLWFRAPEPGDVDHVTRWMNDPRVRRYLARRRFPVSRAAEEEWVRKATTASSPPCSVSMVYGLKGSTEPLGNAGFHEIDWLVREASWGIMIGEPDQWNQGYGREVARAHLRYAFEDLDLQRVALRVVASNLAGVRAYEAAGYQREGCLRRAAVVDGVREDVLAMAVLREEWSEKR